MFSGDKKTPCFPDPNHQTMTAVPPPTCWPLAKFRPTTSQVRARPLCFCASDRLRSIWTNGDGSKPYPFYPFIGSNRSEGGVDCSPQETYLICKETWWYIGHIPCDLSHGKALYYAPIVSVDFCEPFFGNCHT